MIVYVTEQGAQINKRGRRLQVSKGPNQLQTVHLFNLEQLVLLGKVQLSTEALRALLHAGVDTVLLTYSGRFLGRLTSGLSGEIQLRRRQYAHLEQPAQALELARRFVRGKLHNSLVMLRRHNRVLRDPALAESCTAVRRSLDQLQQAGDLDQLRGMEGAAAARHFSSLRTIFRAPGMPFTRRARRPPPDPINILLSLGYTLLTNLVHGMCEQAGLDPYLGALHAPHRNRPSLPLDLVEELRCVLVDTAVVRAVNTRHIVPADFVHLSEAQLCAEEDLWRTRSLHQELEHDARVAPVHDVERQTPADEGKAPRRVRITSAGVKKLVLAFEQRLEQRAYYVGTGSRQTYRNIAREQVYCLARHLCDEGDYQPFLTRG